MQGRLSVAANYRYGVSSLFAVTRRVTFLY